MISPPCDTVAVLPGCLARYGNDTLVGVLSLFAAIYHQECFTIFRPRASGGAHYLPENLLQLMHHLQRMESCHTSERERACACGVSQRFLS